MRKFTRYVFGFLVFVGSMRGQAADTLEAGLPVSLVFEFEQPERLPETYAYYFRASGRAWPDTFLFEQPAVAGFAGRRIRQVRAFGPDFEPGLYQIVLTSRAGGLESRPSNSVWVRFIRGGVADSLGAPKNLRVF